MRLAPVFFVVSFVGFEIAFADEWRNGSAHITCRPDKGFFELRSVQSYYPMTQEQVVSNQARGVHFPAQLEEQPFVCVLNDHKVVVEGRNRVDGAGDCGVRAGALARVTINGTPVKHKFESARRLNSTDDLADGWIELSDCWEHEQSVSVRTNGSYLVVEVCRVESGVSSRAEDNALLTPLSGACKQWSYYGDDPTPYDKVSQ